MCVGGWSVARVHGWTGQGAMGGCCGVGGGGGEWWAAFGRTVNVGKAKVLMGIRPFQQFARARGTGRSSLARRPAGPSSPTPGACQRSVFPHCVCLFSCDVKPAAAERARASSIGDFPRADPLRVPRGLRGGAFVASCIGALCLRVSAVVKLCALSLVLPPPFESSWRLAREPSYVVSGVWPPGLNKPGSRATL